MQKTHSNKRKSLILHSLPVWGSGGQLSVIDFKKERLYQVCMAITRRMLEKSIITDDCHCKIDEFLLKKHRPLLGGMKLNAVDLSAQLND